MAEQEQRQKQYITYSSSDGIATISLNRPEAANAQNLAMLYQVRLKTQRQCCEIYVLRVVVLTYDTLSVNCDCNLSVFLPSLLFMASWMMPSMPLLRTRTFGVLSCVPTAKTLAVATTSATSPRSMTSPHVVSGGIFLPPVVWVRIHRRVG